MERNDILRRVKKLEKNSHPPVNWMERLDHIEDTINLLQSLIAEIINAYERKPRK